MNYEELWRRKQDIQSDIESLNNKRKIMNDDKLFAEKYSVAIINLDKRIKDYEHDLALFMAANDPLIDIIKGVPE